jgi:RNA polymerase sigma-70 factor, ECF subfamily
LHYWCSLLERKELVDMIYEAEIPTARESSTGPLTEWDEQDIVARAKSASNTAFDELVKHYERRVFRLARNITRNNEDAEDVVQTAFVKAFQNLASFREDSRFYTWLVRITVNEALMKIRRRPRSKEVSIDEPKETDDSWAPLEIEDRGPNPEQRYSQQELQQILATTIGELKPVARAVLQLCDVDGRSTKETAEVLALSSTAVKSRLRRARMTLRHSLEKYFRPTSARWNQRGSAEGVFAMTVKHLSWASENRRVTVRSGRRGSMQSSTAAMSMLVKRPGR